ncbi:MAG: hypothetical protein GY699_24555 [Desulfobacteraceae bacterium]|nr:hypothetical protein [Desulfobacteraceae bacterium]
MNFSSTIYAVILSFLWVLPLSANPPIENIFPHEIQNQGWVLEDEPFIAFNESSLSMMINGAAPRYIKLGTQKSAFLNYEKGPVYLMLEIYQTDSNKSSGTLYKEFTSNNPTPLDNLGTKARFASELGGTYMTEFFQDKFYIRLSITQKSESAKNAILKCARIISNKITNTIKK